MEVKKYSLFSCILILLSIYVAVGIGSFLEIFIFPIFHSILPSNLSLDPIFLCLAACLILTLFFFLSFVLILVFSNGGIFAKAQITNAFALQKCSLPRANGIKKAPG